ncbi:MAG: DUF5018 domain-containing protein [Candidatus Cryptobacteroides sp.]
MKKLYLNLIFVCAAMFAAVSCHKPEYVLPTADRQSITSFEAYFTSGTYDGDLLARLEVSAEESEKGTVFEIPIPWFYPEESDEETRLAFAGQLRVKAEFANDCRIDPPLTLLYLNQENEFTFTDDKGNSRKIIITGKRTKSGSGRLMSFNLTEPFPLEGFVSNDNREVYLFSVDDLNAYKAQVTPQAHASVKGGTLVEGTKNTYEIPVADYNSDQKVVVLGHDGTTETEYTISKRVPTKIAYGFNSGSFKKLFTFDPVTRLGAPAYTENVYMSMAYLENSAVICYGNGSKPVYLDGQTGAKKGEINLGSAVADGITSDEAGNMLISSACNGGESLQIYKTNSLTAAPELFYTYENKTDVPAGHNIKVVGDVNGEAVIALAHEGIAGVTVTGKYTLLQVSGGVVTNVIENDVIGLGLSWAAAPVNTPKIVPVSTKAEDGAIIAFYSLNKMNYVKDGKLAAQSPEIANGNFNTICMDAKRFNGAVYAAHLVTGHFPQWSCGPSLRVFDITTPDSISEGKAVIDTGALEIYQSGASGVATGDVQMGCSPDGFKLFIYCYDHNSQTLNGYSADCVKLN